MIKPIFIPINPVRTIGMHFRITIQYTSIIVLISFKSLFYFNPISKYFLVLVLDLFVPLNYYYIIKLLSKYILFTYSYYSAVAILLAKRLNIVFSAVGILILMSWYIFSRKLSVHRSQYFLVNSLYTEHPAHWDECHPLL